MSICWPLTWTNKGQERSYQHHGRRLLVLAARAAGRGLTPRQGAATAPRRAAGEGQLEPVIALVTRPGRPTGASRQADQRRSMHRRPTTSASTRAPTCGRTVSRSRSLGRLVGLSDASIFTPGAWMPRGVSLDTAAVSQGGKHETDQKIRCSIQAGTWRTSPIAPGSLGSTGNDPRVVHEPLQSSMTTRWLGPMLDPLAFGRP